ncbi:hypothetical protein HDU82_008218 [Entophlyctis luteolus]|nr:hypothetical protein HDU82_008218 [Entophlyctis luteolus]
MPPAAPERAKKLLMTIKPAAFVGRAFESKCARVLAALGFRNIRVVGGAGDGGIDIRASLQLPTPAAAPTAPPPILALTQCKCVASKIGPRDLRELEGVMARNSRRFDRFQPGSHASGPPPNPESVPLGILAASIGFSKEARNVFRSSRFPILLLEVPNTTYSSKEPVYGNLRHPHDAGSSKSVADADLLDGVYLFLNESAMVEWKGLSAGVVHGSLQNGMKMHIERLLYRGQVIGAE